MAPTFRHGKSSRLIVKGVDASSMFNEFTVMSSVDTQETTTFGKDDRTFIAGQRTGTLSAQGFLDNTTAGTNDPFKTFRDALGSSTDLVITAIPGAPGGSTVTPGALARLGAAIETSFETAAPAMGVVTAKFDAQVNDRFDFGRVLYGPAAAVTSTGIKTTVDSGVAAGTTGGGVGHFHLTQSSGSVTALVIKIQHSSATVWSDLCSSTALTATPGAKRVAVTGTVKRYTRANVTTITGGGTKSVKIICAFARRGATI